MNNNRMHKNKVVLGIVVVLIVLISITGVIFANVVFNLKGRKFVNLLTKEQYIVQKFEVYKDEFYSNGENNYEVIVKNSYLRQLQDFFDLKKYKASNGDIKLSSNVIVNEKNVDSNITLNGNDIEIIKENETFAVKVSNLFEEYIILEKKNAEESLKKLFNLSGDGNDSIKDAEKFLKKYSGIFASAINDKVVNNENVSITINNDDFETEQYVLTLSTKAFNKMYSEILNNLKEDDKSIEFITSKFNEFESFRGEFIDNESTFEKMSKDEMKQKIIDLYDGVSKNIDAMIDSDEFMKLVLYEYENENIKTEIEIMNGRYKAVFESVEKEGNDYFNINFEIDEDEFPLKYIGEKSDNSYVGKFNIVSNTSPLLAKVTLKKVINSDAEVRKIDELNPSIKLSEADDEKIRKLRESIKQKLKKEDENEIIEGDGIFKLKTPKNNSEVIENSRHAYTRINPIMTKEEAIKIMGTPSKIESGEEGAEYLYWSQGENIDLISVKTKGIKLYNVYNNVAQSEKYNKDLAGELGQAIEDITILKNNIVIGMSKDEVINILGDKFIEVSKSNLGYIGYKWFDKNENTIEIEFDENSNVVQIK